MGREVGRQGSRSQLVQEQTRVLIPVQFVQDFRRPSHELHHAVERTSSFVPIQILKTSATTGGRST